MTSPFTPVSTLRVNSIAATQPQRPRRLEHQLRFENQTALSFPGLARYAVQLGIDDAWLKDAIMKHALAKRVREDSSSSR